MRRVFDALEGAREACFLGEQFCRHPVLPDPAPPPRLRSVPTRQWYVRVLDSTGGILTLFLTFLFIMFRLIQLKTRRIISNDLATVQNTA